MRLPVFIFAPLQRCVTSFFPEYIPSCRCFLLEGWGEGDVSWWQELKTHKELYCSLPARGAVKRDVVGYAFLIPVKLELILIKCKLTSVPIVNEWNMRLTYLVVLEVPLKSL